MSHDNDDAIAVAITLIRDRSCKSESRVLRLVPTLGRNMITLEPSELSWINNSQDDPRDQCAHGRVLFLIDSGTFVTPADGSFTISATALFLLRTLTHDHRIGEGCQLFPCCGFNVWPDGGQFPVMVQGCPSGIDLEIDLSCQSVTIRNSAGLEASTTKQEWKVAVLRFIDAVEAFYNSCSPKEEIEQGEDRDGWIGFWNEWHERRSAAHNTS